jgi:hypothetical protein
VKQNSVADAVVPYAPRKTTEGSVPEPVTKTDISPFDSIAYRSAPEVDEARLIV